MSGRIREGIPSTAADLARTAPFRLGPLQVEPAARTVTSGERREILEPRVMRVLVALGETPGLVLTRDDLIELCWDGQIVSDNAINRVIFLLRRAFEQLADGAVRLETIARVGFRIVVEAPDAGPVVDEPAILPDASAVGLQNKWNRRAAVGGLAALGAVGAFGLASWLTGKPRHVPDPRSLDLYRRGQETQKLGLGGGMQQAMSFYKQAVAIDPDYADAWGALAIGYKHAGQGFMKGEKDSYPRLMASAARHALSLDPEQPDALLALIDFEDRLGSWQADEAKLRGLVKRVPDYWYGLALLDLELQNVGRFDEAVGYRKRSLESDSAIPFSWAMYARGLHYGNRDHEADIALDKAFARWPANVALWITRYQVLMGSKRYAEAAAFARDVRSMPDDLPERMSRELAGFASALATGEGLDAVKARSFGMPFQIEATQGFVPLIAALGDADQTFARLEAYFLGGKVNGRTIAPPEGGMDRQTVVLFAPAVMAMRDDPRWSALLERTGLEDYWRKSRTRPDFRKG